jgi:hypothetical protein
VSQEVSIATGHGGGGNNNLNDYSDFWKNDWVQSPLTQSDWSRTMRSASYPEKVASRPGPKKSSSTSLASVLEMSDIDNDGDSHDSDYFRSATRSPNDREAGASLRASTRASLARKLRYNWRQHSFSRLAQFFPYAVEKVTKRTRIRFGWPTWLDASCCSGIISRTLGCQKKEVSVIGIMF